MVDPPRKHPPLHARPTGKMPSGEEMVERIMRRYPITMARLHEAELRDAEEEERERRERGWE